MVRAAEDTPSASPGQRTTQVPPPEIDWRSIETVFLDMDGTLLDLHFDNHFWLEHVPRRYGEACGLDLAEAKRALRARYRDIEGSLQWYCVDHWSRELGLDIALLKQEVEHLIAVHPHVPEFLTALAACGKRRVLVTNAHQKSISLKLKRTPLAGHLDRIICAHDLSRPKESLEFWERVQAVEPFDRERTLFIDDNERVLETAQNYGFRWLLTIASPDSRLASRRDSAFEAIGDFAELLPALGLNLACRPSERGPGPNCPAPVSSR